MNDKLKPNQEKRAKQKEESEEIKKESRRYPSREARC